MGGEFHVFIAFEGIRCCPSIVMKGLSLLLAKFFKGPFFNLLCYFSRKGQTWIKKRGLHLSDKLAIIVIQSKVSDDVLHGCHDRFRVSLFRKWCVGMAESDLVVESSSYCQFFVDLLHVV